MSDLSIINRNQNPGVYVDEKNQSVRTNTSLTRFDGVIHMVLGFSKVGPQNSAVLMQNATDFKNTFGDIDQKLERKESYFHRTCLKMLETGPTYCMSLLKTDETDNLNWQNFSSASNFDNDTSKTKLYDDFFDKTGFWKKTTDEVISVVNKYALDPKHQLLTFVNYGGQNLTLWIFKSKIKNFDINFENWYGKDNVPSYLHPKELVSDYLVRVVAVKHNWTNYVNLAVDQKWSKYFSVKGLRKESIDSFLSDTSVNVIADYNVSLIPDFVDKNNRALFIETVINADTDQTGIFVAFNRDVFETSFRNGLVDLIGYNLITNNKFSLNFLSYKEQIVDELLINEEIIDQAGNSWGDPAWTTENRASQNAEGYINDTQLKPLIISQTTTFVVKPFVLGSNSYAIIKGKKIRITDSEYLLELNKIVSLGQKFALVLVMTESGVSYRIGPTVLMTASLALPPIDAINEYVIGYYEIVQNQQGEYITTLHGVSITESSQDTIEDGLYGWIPFFSNTFDPIPKIRFDSVNTNFQVKMRFEDTLNIVPGNYNQNRIYYLWYQLTKNLIEKTSLILDIYGNKKIIDKIEPGLNGTDRTLLLTLQDTKNIVLLPPYTYPNVGWCSIYYTDLEFLYQTANYIVTDQSPYSIPENGGRLGPESFLFKAYYDGQVSTGDRVFIEIATENDVWFRNINGDNMIIFNQALIGIYSGKIYINGTINNEGIYTILGTTYYQNNYALIVSENVVEENVASVQFYDANRERYFKFYFINNDLYVQYEDKSLNQDTMLKDIQTLNAGIKYKRTLEIKTMLDNQTVLVDYQAYAGKIVTGNYLQAVLETQDDVEPEFIQKGLTRIIEVYPYDLEKTLLLVRCDSPIQVFEIINTSHLDHGTNAFSTDQILKQTNWFLAIDDWVTTYKGFYLNGFQIQDHSVPDGTEERLAEIISIITPGTGLHIALSNINKIPYRYMIDSFGLGFNSSTKEPMAIVCQKHNSLGFFNMPSIKAFKKHTGLNFLTPEGAFDISKLIAGGDKNSNESQYFTLISGDASANIGYYFPYVEVNDLKTNRPVFIPPASYIADAYMRNKWQIKAANIYPWSIVAGWLNGRINDISAIEMEFIEDDLALLNQMNVNAISKSREERFFVYSQKTAYNLESSLKDIHVREALISFEEDMRNMLLNFHWSFNTESVRETIVKQANSILNRYITQNAFYNGLNKMDSSNNSQELIDAGIGVLDTSLEPIKGMGILLLQLTVLRTGTIVSQFFYR